MDLKTLHFNITTVFHSFFYGPSFISLINKLDKINLKDFIKFIVLIIINKIFENNNILYDTIYRKIDSIEKTTNHLNILSSIIVDIFNSLESSLNNEYSNFSAIKKFSQYYVYGFFLNEYEYKYNIFTNKLRALNIEIEYLSTDINNDIVFILDKKREIYYLLINDFLLELAISIIETHVNNCIGIFNIPEVNNILNNNNISNINFNDFFKNILDKIDNGINSINIHNEKINNLIS
jgi:hypothetical protein